MEDNIKVNIKETGWVGTLLIYLAEDMNRVQAVLNREVPIVIT